MKIIATLWFLTPLLLVSCDSSGLNSHAKFDEQFWLKFGENKFLQSEQLEIGFDELLGDSRCGEDVVCIWAGVARIKLWVFKPANDTTFVTSEIAGYMTAKSEHHVSADTLGYRITLLQLDPYPNTSRQRRLSDYEALLVISNSN